MKLTALSILVLTGAGFGLVAQASAAEVIVDSDITTDTVWTADNTYNLANQVFVTNGASLTIEAGTIIASTPTESGAGALAVTRGSQIFVNGTRENPVIMTSTNDVATWTNGDPKTGTWREAANEWGNLTIMGNALISNSFYAGNTSTPTGSNVSVMEGLTADSQSENPNVLYGGNNDDDDSGSISYLSIRYGGRVVGFANELNGLSLGGIGRGTDISHIEIMNNVDDGIEIWGGTVEIDHFSIWNVGDDSFDVDQGWRGKAQFGLIVQGHSLDDADASQGSGIGDNIFEVDGAEDSDAQPVTTAAIYNVTAIGNPADGDGATAWRDGARVQYRNMIFMDAGERVVRADGDDGDGSNGYGFNGTMDFETLWSTSATTTSLVNIGDADPSALYTAQDPNGFLAEISDSVFFRNLAEDAYTESDSLGVTTEGNAFNNEIAPFDETNIDANMPIAALVRADARPLLGGRTVVPVTSIDPRATGLALNNSSTAPANDDFFKAANYRGGFGPYYNWLDGWTAADAFGFSVDSPSEIVVDTDITRDTTWPAGPYYNLANQVYVTNGAALTIEAGTVVASTPTESGAGALAVTRGSQIFVNGTRENPVIMTSTNDVATWTNGDPKTGTWREAANEWGNLTIMGNALISNSFYAGNTSTPTGSNVSVMEGLTADAQSENPNVLYGGNNDDDDSGSINYLSIRYGGRVVGFANELNGLSLGGIGRGTDINYVEIMNNVDDGIEIWGGTVEIGHFSIWNVGDDSFDVDQGWRGKAQFGLIVQGHSLDDADASQGSGIGDNIFEVDGAEDSDAQPVTTAAIYNVTAIGNPADGDGATAWRDGARVQYRNMIFMDAGERVVRADGRDGDGSKGYGFNGTMDFETLWSTSATTTSLVNIGDADPSALYTAQDPNGFLAEISDSVFFRNLAEDAYTESDSLGVTTEGNAFNNEIAPFDEANIDSNMPIAALVRADARPLLGGRTVVPVMQIDPRAAGLALNNAGTAPAGDDFFVAANYRGGFGPDVNWLNGWSAADAFGFTVDSRLWPLLGIRGSMASDDRNGDSVLDAADLIDAGEQ